MRHEWRDDGLQANDWVIKSVAVVLTVSLVWEVCIVVGVAEAKREASQPHAEYGHMEGDNVPREEPLRITAAITSTGFQAMGWLIKEYDLGSQTP